MWVIIIAALAIAAPFLIAWELRQGTARIRVADTVWGNLEQHAHALLEDRTLDPFIGDLVEGMVHRAGDGTLTRAFLLSLILRGAGRTNGIAVAINKLSAGQENQFFRFAIDAILYDSLRTNFSGRLLRRIVLYWLMATAKDEKAPVNKSQVTPIATVAGKAYHLAC